jgi:hypothetical protein
VDICPLGIRGLIVSFLDAQPRFDYTLRPLAPSGFRARSKPLRARPRLKASSFCLRLSVLSEPEQLGYDGSLRSIIELYKTHPSSPLHRLTAATKRVYVPYANRWARVLAGCRIAELTGLDIMNFHALWGAPRGVYGEPHAGALMARRVLQVLLSFGRACGFSDCRALLDEIAASGFRAPSK